MKRVLRQGDVVLVRLTCLPDGVQEQGSSLEIRGETEGHLHKVEQAKVMRTVVAERPQFRALPTRPIALNTFIVVDAPTVMTHPEHPPLEIPVGIFQVRQAREYLNRAGGD